MVVVVFHALDAAEDFGEVEGFAGDALRFENFLAVADGVEGGGARANGAYSEVAKSFYHAADSCEPLEIVGKLRGAGAFGVQGGDGIGDAILAKVVTCRHLAAETVAARSNRHLGGIVGRGLNENRDSEIGETQGVGDGAFFTEVG